MTQNLAGAVGRPIVLDNAVAVGVLTSTTTGAVNYYTLPGH